MKFCLGFRSLVSGFLLMSSSAMAAPLPDQPFLQDVAVRIQTSPDLAGATFRKLCVDREGVVYVLTDKGVARVYDQTLTLDRSFRPLAGQIAKDITVSPQGDLYYLFAEQWLSNGRNGEPLGHVPVNNYETIAVAENGTVWLAGPGRLSAVGPDGKLSPIEVAGTLKSWLLLPIRTNDLPAIAVDGVFGRNNNHTNITTLARRGDEVLLGTRAGYLGVDATGERIVTPLRTNLPWNEITRIFPVTNGLWIGTSRGAVFQRSGSAVAPALPDGPNGIRYYASKRWLRDDYVVDLATDPEGHLWVLTKTGLNKFEFRTMTLAQKAGYFDKKIRQRHIRFGLTGERRLPNSGDVATSEMIDTDNDGGWTSYYLASQAFRFGATGSAEARFNAWDAFGALERLQTINPLPGFSSRTIERHGFKFSDTDRWREVPGGDWDWKGHTSSDEIASQTFAHAVMWECVVKTDAERERVADNFTRIVDHIIRNNWYLVDVDGKPTLWGRWHPEYVNWFPPTIVDRRLNSAEITASLQLAFAMTGKAIYKEKAYELFERHGYLTNILSAMKLVSATKGFIHQGNDMGDEWNHSDDELAFVTYWPLYRFAFDEGLKAKYGPAVRDHWEYEQPEGYPMWNFIYAGCGGAAACDAPLATWTLRGYPMDTISWSIQNSHRQDLTKLPANFMKREMKELLPPGERQIARCNTQPFTLDAGDNGHIEFPGDEYLFGYWLGRYLKLIE